MQNVTIVAARANDDGSYTVVRQGFDGQVHLFLTRYGTTAGARTTTRRAIWTAVTADESGVDAIEVTRDGMTRVRAALP